MALPCHINRCPALGIPRSYPPHLQPHLPSKLGLYRFWPPYPMRPPRIRFLLVGPPLFRSGFLQTPLHSGRFCRQLMVPLVGPIRDLHPPVSVPCRAHQKKDAPKKERLKYLNDMFGGCRQNARIFIRP